MVVFESYQGFTSGIVSELLGTFLTMIVFYILYKTRPDAKKYIFIMFFIFISIMTYGSYERFKISEKVEYAFKHETYLVVEGTVHKLDPMPKGGHKSENFEVNGVFFKILYTGNYPSEKTLLYTLTKLRDGPIQKNGQHVKIYYIEDELTTICIPFTGRCITFNEAQKNKIIKMWVYKE